MSYQPIENYGIVGDLHTVALVGKDGSIDFMCFPHFDSPSVFAALLDDQKGGRFKLAPRFSYAKRRQLYLPNTNILLTRFLSSEGVAEVSDFMPVAEKRHGHQLIRRAKTVRGKVHFHMICAPAFDYGRASHSVKELDGTMIFISKGADKTVVRLRSDVPLRIENGAVVVDFTLNQGETASFIFEDVETWHETASAAPDYIAEVFKETMNFWRDWVSQSTYRGRWREMVNRSALTLKMLTSHKYGSIIAAPTFGLPEEIGGERNWDYRFTWIRDASFTLYGLMRLGYTSETTAFMAWIEQRCREMNPDGSLQLMYALDGSHDLTERTLIHTEGYKNSSPVRIGNGAHDQLQLDIYGELMNSVYIYHKHTGSISHDFWSYLSRLVEFVCNNWRQPDEGIWEVRAGRQEFTYSRVMCWVAIDRAIRIAQDRAFPAPLERWQTVRDEIYNEVFENHWSPKLQAFVQHKGSEAVDASCLLMPLVKFISPTDPRWLSTLKAIEELLVEDSLVYRYNTINGASDGLSGGEGTFSMCSFWYVECLSRSGDLEKARFIFEKTLGYANHLGLYAEELGPCGEHLGNFPQAFSHLALISAACNLDYNISEARN